MSLDSRDRIIIFLGALVARLGYVLTEYKFESIGGSFVSGDSFFYLKLAESLLAGGGLATETGPTAFVSPGFPLFLAACRFAFGTDPLWTSLFQCVLSAAACLFVAETTAVLFGNRAGFIGGVIAAGYYELVLWTSGQLLTEPLYFFLLAAALLALVAAAADRFRFGKICLAGALFGLAALVRPTALPVVIGLAGAIFVAALVRRRSRRQWRPALVFVAVCLLVMLPWGLRNQVVLGSFTLLSTEGGHVFWLGNNPAYDLFEHPDFARFGGYTIMFEPPPELAAELNGKSEAERGRIYARHARSHIFADPAAFFVRGLHKNWNMWRPGFAGSSWRNRLVSLTFYPVLLLLFLAGVVLAARRAGKELLDPAAAPAGLLLTFLLVHLAMHSVITGEIRFRVPLWAAIIPFAALALEKTLERLGTVPAARSQAPPASA